MGIRRKFSREGNIDILLIISRFQCEWTFKNDLKGVIARFSPPADAHESVDQWLSEKREVNDFGAGSQKVTWKNEYAHMFAVAKAEREDKFKNTLISYLYTKPEKCLEQNKISSWLFGFQSVFHKRNFPWNSEFLATESDFKKMRVCCSGRLTNCCRLSARWHDIRYWHQSSTPK